jgi:hypothetical protein
MIRIPPCEHRSVSAALPPHTAESLRLSGVLFSEPAARLSLAAI